MTFPEQEPNAMMIDLEDPELTARLLAADPVDVRVLRAAATSAQARDLRDAIVLARPAVPRRRRRIAYSVAGLAAAVAVGVPLGLTVVHPSAERAYAAPLVQFARNSPRMLVTADGWRVTRADEDDPRTGEMTFAKGTRRLDVSWSPGDVKLIDKRDMSPLGHASIDGQRAWVGTFGDRDFEALWSIDGQTLAARGIFPSKASFLDVARTLRRVSVHAWLDAMPAYVVEPAARAGTVEKMLADIPLPRGFDAGSFMRSALVLDRYQLGARVTGAVSCAWVRQWVHGDRRQRAEASRAMATSRHWAILDEMKSEGAYPDVVWMFADALNGKPTRMTPLDDLEAMARQELGC